MGMIGQLIATIAQFVPWWLLVITALIVGGVATPGYLAGLRVKKVKALMRKTVRAETPQRLALQQQVYAYAKHHGDALLALAKEADKLNQPRLRDRALARLRTLGTHPDELRKLEAPADPRADRRHAHPVEAAAAISNLVEIEAWEAAKERLDEALERFPTDPALLRLREQLPRSRRRP